MTFFFNVNDIDKPKIQVVIMYGLFLTITSYNYQQELATPSIN